MVGSSFTAKNFLLSAVKMYGQSMDRVLLLSAKNDLFSIQFKSPVHPIRTKLNNRSKIYLNTIPGNNLKFIDFKGGYQYENMPDISEIFVKRVLSLIYEGISVSKSQKSFSKTESFIKTYVHFFTNRFDYILSSPWLKITIIKDKDLTSRKFARLVKSPNCTNQKYILK